ncbi:MAG TPA: rhomboid family intramembrane serine protease [Chitinophagales bacterium]|nr:rhomboid family intramembrane serine protease [Chitinophagales bacterium]
MFNINTRSITFNIIVINVLLFLATMMNHGLTDILSLHYFFNVHHYDGGVGFKAFQILTHMFMHGGFFHILFNMWGLFMFGTILEHVWGPRRFLIFYLTTGLGAVLLHMGVQLFLIKHWTGSFDPSLAALNANPEAAGLYVSQTLGASGAIFGIATAFAMLFPNTELMIFPIPVPIKAKYLMPGYILLELYLGISMHSGDNVAHFAHLGGALFGFIIVKLWNHDRGSLY